MHTVDKTLKALLLSVFTSVIQTVHVSELLSSLITAQKVNVFINLHT